MKVNFTHKTLQQYLNQLSSKEPVPGGGSAAALTAALGVGLIAMAAQYSIGRKNNIPAIDQKLKVILNKAEVIRCRLLDLVSLDSEAYLELMAARNAPVKVQRAASKKARAVPLEVCKLCYQAIHLTSYLAEKGNPWLLSDVEVAMELLMAGFNGARVMVRINS